MPLRRAERSFLQFSLPRAHFQHLCALTGDKDHTDISVISEDGYFGACCGCARSGRRGAAKYEIAVEAGVAQCRPLFRHSLLGQDGDDAAVDPGDFVVSHEVEGDAGTGAGTSPELED